MKGIINPETLAAHKAGTPAIETILGGLGRKTLTNLGLEAESVEFQIYVSAA